MVFNPPEDQVTTAVLFFNLPWLQNYKCKKKEIR